MAELSEMRALRFRAGEVGFVFYEEPAPGIMGIGRVAPIQERTYAFGTIGDAAAWLIQQFGDRAPEPFKPLGNTSETA